MERKRNIYIFCSLFCVAEISHMRCFLSQRLWANKRDSPSSAYYFWRSMIFFFEIKDEDSLSDSHKQAMRLQVMPIMWINIVVVATLRYVNEKRAQRLIDNESKTSRCL
ncbi:hypothetical protein ACKWTF_006685 [Chironomus riparius]